MKKLLLLSLLISQTYLVAQTFEVEQIKTAGADDKRINLVILGEGYTASEFDAFETHANNFVNSMFSQAPFSEYTNYFNVYIIKVASPESGATHPGTASDEPTGSSAVPISVVNNYFGAAYDSYGTHRLLYSPNYNLITDVLATNFPEYDQVLILVNAPYYGGSGGTFPFAATDASSVEIAIHELGHSFVNLKDEYWPGDIQAAEAINMTQDNTTSTIRWKNWIGSNNVGAFRYANSGTAATWYRPHQNCKMRYLGSPFCAVCTEGIIEKIHSMVSPIDSYSPVSNDLEDPSFPLELHLDLVLPLPNTLETEWTLNGEVFSNELQDLSILEANLVEGINTLTAVVTDNTALLRVDGHDTFHMYTVTWSIDYSTLGIDTISSEGNTIRINMYPNPVENILNVSVESRMQKDFSLTLTSINGKQLLSTNANSSGVTVINLESLSSGIYIVNIFQDGVSIGQKKLVKE